MLGAPAGSRHDDEDETGLRQTDESRLLMRRVRLAYLHMAYKFGGIEAINRELLRADRVEEILAEFGASIGADTVLHGPLVIHNAVRDYSNLRVGNTVHIGRLAILDLTEPIALDDQTVVSMGTTILTHSDVGERPLGKRYQRKTAAVRVGPGAYIGANVTVLAGCDIGRESVVGAGAVVTRPVPDSIVVIGVPAMPADSLRQRCSDASSPDASGCKSEGIDVIDEV
jgi:acetyltransferase-like isoleucine patch superfamily enzyme